MADKIAIILSKNRDGHPEHQRLEKKLLAGLEAWPYADVTVLPHLYDLTADGPGMRFLRSTDANLIVLSWLYPRAAYWVLNANQVKGRLQRTSSLPEEDLEEPNTPQADASDRTIWCFDLRTHDEPGPYLDEIGRIVAMAAGRADESKPPTTSGHMETVEEATSLRWYPVIDYGRCTNCLECLNFCLFGVYELDESDVIIAEQPDACRPGCPACARICPAAAIMFPQHKDPAIAGDPHASLKGLKLDLSQLFGGLSPAELAAGERDRALAEQGSEEGRPTEAEPDQPAEKDELDRLVDELDELDL